MLSRKVALPLQRVLMGAMMKVLIVEDERALADALEHIIRYAGYAVDTVYIMEAMRWTTS